MLNAYFETYGCSNNAAESEIMKGILNRAGFIIVNNKEIADILIINTCIVKGPTLNKMRARISALSKLNKPLIVAGCMPAIMNKEILKLNKNASLISTHNIDKILLVVKKALEREPVRLINYNKEVKLNKPRIRKNPLIAIVPISSGCLGNCSFCITRLAKGNLYSFPEENIIKEIKDSIVSKCKEIWLTSQDCASYGLDMPQKKIFLPELLNKILSLKGKFLVRLGMSNPNHILPISKELIELYKNHGNPEVSGVPGNAEHLRHPKMFKFLHIPLQSGSDKILKAMNRRYSANDFRKIIKNFRSEISGITISTDIIVGFPNESEQDFEETLKVLEETRPDIINIARFWPMSGTKASQMPQLSQKVIMERTKKLMDLHTKLSLSINQPFIGKEMKVLVDENKEGLFVARDSAYRFVILKGDKSLLGKIVNAKIVGADAHHLIGEIKI